MSTLRIEERTTVDKIVNELLRTHNITDISQLEFFDSSTDSWRVLSEEDVARQGRNLRIRVGVQDDEEEDDDSGETVLDAAPQRAKRETLNLLLGDKNISLAVNDLSEALQEIRTKIGIESISGLEYYREAPEGSKSSIAGTWKLVTHVSEIPAMAKIRVVTRSLEAPAAAATAKTAQTYDLMIMDPNGNRRRSIAASSLSELKDRLRTSLQLQKPIYKLEFCVNEKEGMQTLVQIEQLPLKAKIRIVDDIPRATKTPSRPTGGHSNADSALSPTLSLASLSPASNMSSAFSSPASSFATPSPSPPPGKFSLPSRQHGPTSEQHQLGAGVARNLATENMVMFKEYKEAMRSPNRQNQNQSDRRLTRGGSGSGNGLGEPSSLTTANLVRHVGGGSSATNSESQFVSGPSAPLISPQSSRPKAAVKSSPGSAGGKIIWLQHEGLKPLKIDLDTWEVTPNFRLKMKPFAFGLEVLIQGMSKSGEVRVQPKLQLGDIQVKFDMTVVLTANNLPCTIEILTNEKRKEVWFVGLTTVALQEARDEYRRSVNPSRPLPPPPPSSSSSSSENWSHRK